MAIFIIMLREIRGKGKGKKGKVRFKLKE